MMIIPLARSLKTKWFQMHCKHCFCLKRSFKSILIGDSLIAGLHCYYQIWNNFFKPTDALNCGIRRDKVQNDFMVSAEFTNFFFFEKCLYFVRYQQFTAGFSRGYCWWHYWDWTLFKKRHYLINIFICRLLPHDECTPMNRVCIIGTTKILKVKCSLNKFFFTDQDTYWIQPNGCLNSDMFYLDKLHLVEKKESSLS